eukprot:748200-Hanusia_phi.AAC.2
MEEGEMEGEKAREEGREEGRREDRAGMSRRALVAGSNDAMANSSSTTAMVSLSVRCAIGQKPVQLNY